MSAMSTADKTHLFHAIQLEKLNWKIHLLFVTKDFKNCLELIENELRNSKGQSDYPLIVKGRSIYALQATCSHSTDLQA